MSVEIRPMRDGDVEGCDRVWHDASTEMRQRFDLPVAPYPTGGDTVMQGRIRHLLGTDPDGARVAVDGDRVVGLSQALQRERLWVLSLYAVDVAYQGAGLAKALLERTLEYGDRTGPGLIQSSRDPKAMRRYALAGFDLHPAMVAWGRVDKARLPSSPRVREGGVDDLPLVDTIDRVVRGASHGPDVRFLLDEGRRLLIHDDGGYAVVTNGRASPLGATDPRVARELFAAGLRSAPDDTELDTGWLTAGQQWAFQLALEVGMELHPHGAIFTRGMAGPPSPYIPTGAFG